MRPTLSGSWQGARGIQLLETDGPYIVSTNAREMNTAIWSRVHTYSGW
jgi:hypothetical protein